MIINIRTEEAKKCFAEVTSGQHLFAERWEHRRIDAISVNIINNRVRLLNISNIVRFCSLHPSTTISLLSSLPYLGLSNPRCIVADFLGYQICLATHKPRVVACMLKRAQQAASLTGRNNRLAHSHSYRDSHFGLSWALGLLLGYSATSGAKSDVILARRPRFPVTATKFRAYLA